MHLHINHSFCLDSNWGGDFSSRYMVIISKNKKVDQKDFSSLTTEKTFFDESKFKSYVVRKNIQKKEETLFKDLYTEKYHVLKKEVLEWLKGNVKNTKNKDQPNGWCVGSDKYQSRSGNDVIIWFERKSDAMDFIKKFSHHKKPTTVFNYFKEVRQELDLKTNKLKKVNDYSEIIEEFS